nr:immunoglobulin light chain junction region [Macaca mulatta]MOY14996.1 immunoglobulin light chain junction region [Macaca mulatta]MOY17213.1 immunoglobulin light chain junction region [Macaca mulatta]
DYYCMIEHGRLWVF